MPDAPWHIPAHSKINAHDLRRLADAAESVRGKPMYVSSLDDGTLEITFDNPPEEGWLFEVETDPVGNRKGVAGVFLVPEDGEEYIPLAPQYDAVFWSESAVEKFLLPYYASKSMWEAAAKLRELSMVWYGEVPPDRDGQPEPGVRSAPGHVDGSLPIALAHTPDSDWARLGGDEFHALVRTENGVKGVPVSRLMAERRRSEGRETGDPAPRTPAAPAAR